MSRTSRRVGLGGLVAALVLVGLTVPAWAYFSVGSTVAVSAGRAATLGTPTVGTSGVTASSVTFTVTAPNGGPTPTGYRIARTAPSAAASVCTVAGANGSCTDTSPVSGQSNSYAVYAVLAGTQWESPTAATTSVVVPSAADTTAPSVSITSPAAGSINGGQVTVSGNATDNVGVTSVTVAYQGPSSGTVTGTATLGAGTWSIPWATSALTDGTYSLTATAKDAAGNSATSTAVSVTLKNTFTVSNVPATTTAGSSFSATLTTYPGYSGSKSLTISGTASPSGSQPTVTTPVTFTGGTATITVTLTAAGTQTFTIRDANLATMTGTSSSVNVNAGSASRLAWTTFYVGSSQTPQPLSTCYFTCNVTLGNNVLGTSNLSVTDTFGNILNSVPSAVSISVTAPPPNTGSPAAAQTFTIAAGAQGTTTSTWTYKENGGWTSRTFTASANGLTSANLTVTK